MSNAPCCISEGTRAANTRLRIIALAPNSWEGQWVNRQQLLSRLGDRHLILYSTGGWFSWDRYSPEWRGTSFSGAFTPVDNVRVDKSPKYLLRTPKVPLIDRSVLNLQVHRWRRWLDARGNEPLIAHLFHPLFFPYLRYLRPNFVVYHAYDLFQKTPSWTEELAQNERELLERANLVVASSQSIADGMSAACHREIKILPNGADVAAFEKTLDAGMPEPDDLREIPHPRIGYIGSLHPQVDYILISALAKRQPGWQFVLVGHIVSTAGTDNQTLMDCRTLPNVHILGPKPRGQVPHYAVNMDINIMCYRLDGATWINAGYPLKLHEYLAAGKPVVSADLTSVRPFSSVVRIASGIDDWHEAILDGLESRGTGSRDERQAVARENSWNARADQLEDWWLKLVNKAEDADKSNNIINR